MPRIRPPDVLLPAAQIAAVAANTVFLASDAIAAAAVTSYLISYLWTRNVRRIAAATEFDRHVYAGSCMIGAAAGWALAKAVQHM